MQGDDIRNQRQQAEKDSGFANDHIGVSDPIYHQARAILALFICAEQLFEIRANLETLVERGGPTK